MTALALALVLHRQPIDPAVSEFTRVQEQWVAEATPAAIRDSYLPAAVRELGSRSYATRERAARELAWFGAASVPALSAATMSPDPEIAGRAWRVLAVIHRCPRCSGSGSGDGWNGLCQGCQGSRDTRCVGQRVGYYQDPRTGGYVERYEFSPKILFMNPNL